ncbi:MAG TPA: hypothetical protein VIW27_04965 [Gammaproteobacteria bacterium]
MQQKTHDGRRGGGIKTKFAACLEAPWPSATRILPTRQRHAALARLESRSLEDAGITTEPSSTSCQTLAEELEMITAACDSSVREDDRAGTAAQTSVQSPWSADTSVARDSLAANCNREIDAWARHALAANGFGDLA